MHIRLFIPGPVEVHPAVLSAMSVPMFGHREKEYVALHAALVPKLQRLLCTKNPVFLSTSSSTGMMEGAVRNCVSKRVLSCMLGAFSDRWHEIATSNGKEADPLQVEWGKAITPKMIDERLATGKYDAVTLVHNETSTGVMNPLAEIAAVMRKHPDVIFIVDTVSSLAGVPIEIDSLGIDVCLAGVQKCFGLPPGLCVVSVSPKAVEKAKTVPNRGYYFDFIEFLEYHQKNQTPCTPVISLIHALNVQMDRMFEEGIDIRYKRHRLLAERCRMWAKERFALFPEPGYESVTLTAVSNTRGADIKVLNAAIAKRGMTISGGYGKLKEKTFRIAHMADCTMADLETLLKAMDEILREMKVLT